MSLSTPSFTAQLHAALDVVLYGRRLSSSLRGTIDGVAEIRDAYQVTLRSAVPPSKAKRTRRTTESMKTKVLNLHARGVVPAAISDTLNISDRRVSEILRAA